MKLRFNANQYKSYLTSINDTISKIVTKSKKDKGLMYLKKEHYLIGKNLTEDCFEYKNNKKFVKQEIMEKLEKSSSIFYGITHNAQKEKLKLIANYKKEDYIYYDVDCLTLRLYLMQNCSELLDYRYENNYDNNHQTIDIREKISEDIIDIFNFFATGTIVLHKEKDDTYWVRCYNKDKNIDWYYDNSFSYLDIAPFLSKFDFKGKLKK
jgi:hypothetical protein